MKGLITKAVLATGCSGILGSLGGCNMTCKDLYDPCYPQRYEAMSREEAAAASAPQIQNGHVLDQTVWNYHFETGTDRLTPGGQDHLAYLARRRPQADPSIYIQTAQDVSYDPASPDKYSTARYDLDGKRIAAVQKFLHAQTAGRHQEFTVLVHDPSEVGISAISAGVTALRHAASFQGSLPLSGGGGGGGGGAGGGGSAGGSGGGSSGGSGSGSGGSGSSGGK
ncbi:MAG TPA: hypothetical protein VGZ25_08825 [Gemmataceae bacterium]|nr:hypothetical protein [Gemmataceae bacterium]